MNKATTTEEAWTRPTLADFGHTDVADMTAADRACFAWAPANAATFDAFKLPIRRPGGPINLNAVRNALARLPGTDGIPSAEKVKIRARLQQLLGEPKDAKKDLTGDVHIPTAIGTSMRQSGGRRRFPVARLKDVTIIKNFVALGTADPEGAKVPTWIRSSRHLPVRVYGALKKAEIPARPGPRLPEGMAFAYDLVLRPIGAADEDPVGRYQVRFLKADAAAPAQQKVLGVVMEPHRVDTQGDFEEPADIEAACHQFANDYRMMKTHVGLQHQQMLSDDAVTVIENYILPADTTIGGQDVPKGSWLQMHWVKDPTLWKAITDGAITGFSFGGDGLRQHVNAADAEHVRTR